MLYHDYVQVALSLSLSCRKHIVLFVTQGMSASSRSINFSSSTAMASVLNCWVDSDFVLRLGLISVSSDDLPTKAPKSPVSILQGGRLREEHHFYKVN